MSTASRVLLLGLVATLAGLGGRAVAQSQVSIDQISPPPAANAASPVRQIPTSTDRVSVVQLPADARDRRQAPSSEPDASVPARAATDTGATLVPRVRHPNSVDADEIARLLNEGEAATIDAAAAIATSRAAADAAEESMEERSLRLRAAAAAAGALDPR